ncbi:complement C1q-like protein 3 [Crassostrea angulata]|uniref:complement C1q-like protein 3 n=1 Tax=Magallana angulata TaxID=2784310 RepID=UPI0022B1A816|nr:complement C1q-like protein 3 [Crassostrea angulata]
MKTQLSVALVFVLCGIGINTAATDCISRKEFDDFKANVLNHIQELTLKNDKQAKEIEYQKKAILDLKRMLVKYDETSNNSNQNDTAVTSNQSLPGEPSMLSTKDSLKPPRKREAMQPRQLTANPTDVIAFYAYLTNAEINPGAHHIIVYDHVITNSGNGYSKHSGSFTAPKAGMYVFSWTTFVDPHSYFPIELIHNSVRAGIVFVQGDTTFNGVTGLAVIQLQQGDVVMVRSEPGYTPHGNIHSEHHMKTSFAGWCISCSSYM